PSRHRHLHSFPTRRSSDLAQLDGGLSRRIQTLRERILELEALSAYDIDFPEEDDGPIPASRVLGVAASLIETLDNLLATAPVGEDRKSTRLNSSHLGISYA